MAKELKQHIELAASLVPIALPAFIVAYELMSNPEWIEPVSVVVLYSLLLGGPFGVSIASRYLLEQDRE